MQKTSLPLLIIAVLVFGGFLFFGNRQKEGIAKITNFNECFVAGNAVLESFPRQCKTQDGRTFIEDIGNILEKMDLIRVTTPKPNTVVSSPLFVSGQARGNWFFEASFPVQLIDESGQNIPLEPSYIMTAEDWMTSDFVHFEATLLFDKPTAKTGVLFFQKDNPSGLPEFNDEMHFPVMFGQ